MPDLLQLLWDGVKEVKAILVPLQLSVESCSASGDGIFPQY